MLDFFLPSKHQPLLGAKLELLIFLCLLPLFVFAQERVEIKGSVMDSATETPIPEVNIIEKGTSNGVVTDFYGNFSIKVPKNAILEISFIGYTTKEISLDGRTELMVFIQKKITILT